VKSVGDICLTSAWSLAGAQDAGFPERLAPMLIRGNDD